MPNAVAEKHTQILGGERFKGAEFEFNRWVANVEETTKPEDVLDPNFWGHNAHFLKPWDIIHVRADDGSWYTELLVQDVQRAWAKVHVLQHHSLGDPAEAKASVPPAMYRPKWGGPQLKWTVIRQADNERVSDGHGSERMAMDWIADRLKAR